MLNTLWQNSFLSPIYTQFLISSFFFRVPCSTRRRRRRRRWYMIGSPLQKIRFQTFSVYLFTYLRTYMWWKCTTETHVCGGAIMLSKSSLIPEEEEEKRINHPRRRITRSNNLFFKLRRCQQHGCHKITNLQYPTKLPASLHYCYTNLCGPWGKEGGENFCVKSRFALGVPPLMLPKVENSFYTTIYKRWFFHSWVVIVPKTHKEPTIHTRRRPDEWAAFA
jgi:hypothetical protein